MTTDKNLSALQLNYLDELLTVERDHADLQASIERLEDAGKTVKAATAIAELTSLEQIYRNKFARLKREHAETGVVIAAIHRLADMIRASNGQSPVTPEMRAAFSCGPGCK